MLNARLVRAMLAGIGALLSLKTSAHALTYTCAEVGSFAMTVYDAKSEGVSLGEMLDTIQNDAAGDDLKVEILQGVALAVYGDKSLDRDGAFRAAFTACNNAPGLPGKIEDSSPAR